MKEEQRVITLDEYEEGAVITALNDMRNKGLSEQESTDFVDELLLKILNSPQKKVKVRNEAR
jgi:hypothetical protein